MSERIFVFTEVLPPGSNTSRPMLHAFRESDIKHLETQRGSQNCYLKVNGLSVEGSFEQLVEMLGTPVYFK